MIQTEPVRLRTLRCVPYVHSRVFLLLCFYRFVDCEVYALEKVIADE